MKQNDWIIANLNNPDFSVNDFQNIANLNIENTQFLDKEDYLESDTIKNNDLFKDNNGEFNEDKFNDFYKASSEKFKELAVNNSVDSLEYNLWDVRRTPESKVKDTNFQFVNVPNPDRISIGIAGRNALGEREKSVSELAQESKIFDSEKLQFIDESPNDRALLGGNKNPFTSVFKYFKSLGQEPLIIAKWDKDGVHLENGKEVKHYKGLYKLNAEGTYYTETLNGRSPIGLEFISALDTITVDSSKINKYDFFDSDGLDKSTTGTIVKNLAVLAPTIALGPVGVKIYAGMFIAKELAKALPMLADIVTLFGEDVDSKFVNTVAGYGHKFTSSTTEYSKDNLFSFENFGNLISDVALLWGQQKTIASAISNLKGSNAQTLQKAYFNAFDTYQKGATEAAIKYSLGLLGGEELMKYAGIKKVADISLSMLEGNKWMNTPLGLAALKKFLPAAQEIVLKRTKMGLDLALLYMAIVSNTDVYESAILKGGTKKEAAAMALGSTLGMFSVDKYLHLGEIFYDDAKASEKILFRNTMKKEADAITSTFNNIGKAATEEPLKWYSKLIKKGLTSSVNAIKNYQSGLKDHTLGFFGKAIGEGIEEVSEEVVTDVFKSLGELAGEFGYFSKTDYGAWENAGDRYLMSLLGGAIGGGLFYGVDAIKNPKTLDEKQTLQSLIYLFRNHKKKDIMDVLDNMHKKGLLGNKNLSIMTEGDEHIFVTPDENHISQNDYVYDRIKESIDQLDLILNENNLNKSDDELFDNMVLSEYTFLKLKDYLQSGLYASNYHQDFQKLVTDIYETDVLIKALQKDNPNPSEVNQLSILEAKKLELIAKRDLFLNGELSLPYVEKMLFAIDTGLNEPFISLNFDQWVRHNYNKDVENLSDAEKETYSKEYTNYTKLKGKHNVNEAFNLYKNMGAKIQPIIESLNKEDILSWGKVLEAMQKTLPKNKILTYNDKLDSESDEEFESRLAPKENESEEDFIKRVQERETKLQEYNNSNLQKFYEEFIKGLGAIDPNTYRMVLDQLNIRKSDHINNLIDKLDLIKAENNSSSEDYDITRDTLVMSKIKDALHNLKEDGSNKEDVKETIRNIITEGYETFLKNQNLSFRGNYDEVNSALRLKEINEEGEEVDKRFYNLQDVFNRFTEILNNKPEIDSKEKLKDFLAFDGFSEENLDLWTSLYFDTLDINNKKLQLLQALEDGSISEEELTKQLGELDSQLVDTEEIIAKSDELLNTFIDDFKYNIAEQFTNLVDTEIIENLLNDKWLKIFKDFEHKLKKDFNPVLKLLKQINPILNSTENIEDILVDILELYESAVNPNDFELSTTQYEILNLALESLNFIKAFLYGASTNIDKLNPIGHNKLINLFAEKHKDIFKDFNSLPELDKNISNVYNYSVEKYIDEIKFWQNKSNQNSIDKKQKQIKAAKALDKTKVDFFTNNREGFKLSNGIDLLEGIDDLDTSEEDFIRAFKLNNLLYVNTQKALASGVEFSELFKLSVLNITNVLNIKQLITSDLDENLTYASLTDYDKYLLLVSQMVYSATDFYKSLKLSIENNNNIVPLSILEHLEFLTQALQHAPELINQSLDIIQELSDIKLPIVYSGTIVTGLGGGGKTAVVAKKTAEEIPEDSIWLSGPTDTQVNTLQNLVKSEGFTREKLFNTILDSDQYSDLLKSLEEGKKCKLYKKFTGIDGSDGVKVIAGNLKFNTISKLPKLLIIDEITHFSSAEILILGIWAKNNNINLFLTGDDNLLGADINIDRETVLAWRSPRLNISLRDSNIQKVKNLKLALELLETLRKSSEGPGYKELIESVYADIKNILPSYYLDKDDLNGEIIVDDVSEDLISTLQGEVGYVGNPTDDLYKQLKDAGINITAFLPTEILGREFNYVIINKNWELLQLDENGLNALNFLKDYYTMISRSKIGTIIIDNGLTSIIKNSKADSVKAQAPSILTAKEEFRNFKLELISKLDLSDLNIPKIKPTPEPPAVPPTPKPSVPASTSEEEEKKEIEEIDLSEDDSSNNSGLEEEVNEENAEQEQNNINSLVNYNNPVRIYTNIHLLGVNKDKSNESIWTNDSNSARDIGIFLPNGKSVEKGEDKDNLVSQLLDLKSAIVFGIDTYYDELPTDIKRLLGKNGKENLKNMKFYLSASSLDDFLIGMTNLDLDKLKINNKILSVVGKFIDASGRECSITLGTLANPETWKKNKSTIKTAIQKRIDAGDPDSKNLEEYKNKLDVIVDLYTNAINDLCKEEDLEFEIEKPNFSSRTDLIRSDPSGNPIPSLRLEDINSKKLPWKQSNKYAVTSNIYTLTSYKDKKFKVNKGVSIMYVSANRLLDPNKLELLYWAQKDNPGGEQSVRMLVLDNEGVSFRSLYTKKYSDIYNLTLGNRKLTIPAEAEVLSMRMFMSMWNFRANLKLFINVTNKFAESSSLEHINSLAKLDADTYRKLLIEKRNSTKNDKAYLSEEEYRKIVKDNNLNYDSLKELWDFNDSLSDSVRQFRLGYNTTNGIYVRKLTNLKDGGFYKDPNNTYGLYINYDMAVLYEKVLDFLFDNVVNKLIPIDPNVIKPTDWIDPKSKKATKDGESWVDSILKDRKLTISLVDRDENNKLVPVNKDIEIPQAKQLRALPFALINIAKKLNLYSMDEGGFMVTYESSDYLDIKINDEKINYLDIEKCLEAGLIIETSKKEKGTNVDIVGVHDYTAPDGTEEIVDFRLDNLWNFMFHGFLQEKENDFDGNELRATDANFKFGIFSDPFMFPLKSSSGNILGLTATNRKLFSNNNIISFPTGQINITKKENISPVNPINTNPEKNNNLDVYKESILNIVGPLGITINPKELELQESVEDLIKLVNSKLNSNFDKYFQDGVTNGIFMTDLPIEIIFNTSEDNFELKYLKDTPKFKNIKIINQTKIDTYFDIETEEGQHYAVNIINGEIEIDEIIEEKIKTYLEILDNIKNVIDSCKDITENDKLNLKNEITDILTSKTDLTQPVNNSLNIILNSIDDVVDNYEYENIDDLIIIDNLINDINNTSPKC